MPQDSHAIIDRQIQIQENDTGFWRSVPCPVLMDESECRLAISLFQWPELCRGWPGFLRVAPGADRNTQMGSVANVKLCECSGHQITSG